MLFETLPNGATLPKIGYGTWNVGGGMTPDYSQNARAVSAIRAALEIGYTHIDTAEMYADGHTEELVRQAIKAEGTTRGSLFITTKVWHTNLRYKDIHKAVDGSLLRLNTDYLDLYLIHWPSSRVPLSETFQALNELVGQGKVRHLGVSNFNLSQLRDAQAVSNTPILTNQVPYSLHARKYASNGVLQYCQENDILLTAYTPVEKGRVAKDPVLKELGAKYGATPVQIALAWLIRQPRVIAIPMSQNPKHIRENLEAADVDISIEDAIRLDRLQ